jgi:colanic acid/amylovoran biosynthesis protein
VRVLIDAGSYALNNLGDVAMLQVAVRRLQVNWPSAEIRVLTSAPEALARCCPGTKPVPAQGMRRWFEMSYLPARWHMPAQVARRAARPESWLRQRWPSLMDSLALRRARGSPSEAAEVRSFLEAAETADLVLWSGGGYLNDTFSTHTAMAMDLIRRCQRNAVPTALMGQGIGPLADETLIWRARAALPLVDRVALRESRAGLPLLTRLGVPSERVTVTGDDAIEPAFAERRSSLGAALGFNVRVSRYSNLDAEVLRRLRSGLERAAAEIGAEVLGIPISLAPGESDAESLCDFFEENPSAVRDLQAVRSPEDVIRRIGECRVVVTGSYHAGVFALSQGIPVVGLSRSRYYADKFLGLAEAFGNGCRVLLLDQADPHGELPSQVRELWERADDLRAGLLAAAACQIAAGKEAYRDLGALGSGTTVAAHRELAAVGTNR